MTVARRKAAQAKRGTGTGDINPHDALVLLTADHNEIDKLVREFERRRKAADSIEKGKLALRICHALALHETVKMEVFYPAAEAVLEGEDRERLARARVEREALHDLIAKVENMPADDPSFEATVLVLGDQADRHMKEEEEEIFPKVRHSSLDLLGTGERMSARKTELATTPLDSRTIRQARKVMSGRSQA